MSFFVLSLLTTKRKNVGKKMIIMVRRSTETAGIQTHHVSLSLCLLGSRVVLHSLVKYTHNVRRQSIFVNNKPRQ